MAEPRKTNRACLECTRRKIRCDGTLPCKNCQNNSVQERCGYRKRNRRTNPSWRTITRLTEALENRNELLRQLLPAVDFTRVPGLSREKVIHIVNEDWDDTSTSPNNHSEMTNEGLKTNQVLGNPQEANHEWNEAPNGEYCEPLVGDAVNCLTLEQSSSHLGNSSILAILCALFALCPQSKEKFLDLRRSFLQKRNQPVSEPENVNPPRQSTSSDEKAVIDAYFDNFHSIIPIVDETWFRATILDRERADEGWIVLSNVVMALGSIAAGNDNSHFYYFSRARESIGYRTFATGSLEMLQALILLGGLYLHYINSPNTAYLIMGTAFRMAIVLGIHRDHSAHTNSKLDCRCEVRSRIWLTLVCADAWQGLVLDRPKIIEWGSLTTVFPLPEMDSRPFLQPQATNGAQHSIPGLTDWHKASLRDKVELCIILHRIQDRLAQLTPLTAIEILAFNDQLQLWSKSRPLQLRSRQLCPKDARHSRELRRCLFLGTLLCISRPHLLHLMNSSVSHNFTNEDWKVVSICLNTANLIVQETVAHFPQDRISVWYSTFYLFQACLVLLFSVTISKRLERFSKDEVREWIHNLERAIQTFKDMTPYKRPVDRYGEVVAVLYDGVLACDEDVTSGEQSIDSIESIGLELTDSLMDVFQPNMTTSDMTLDWFDYDLGFSYGETGDFYQPPNI